MLEVQRRELQLRNMFHPMQCEAMALSSRLREIGKFSDGGVVSSVERARVRRNDARYTLGVTEGGEHRGGGSI